MQARRGGRGCSWVCEGGSKGGGEAGGEREEKRGGEGEMVEDKRQK